MTTLPLETNKSRWEQCQRQAAEIVSRYRSEAPEGCDPQNTWVAIGVGVAGVAVSAGSAAYAQNKSKKAAEKAGQTQYNTTPELLDDPSKVDPYQVLQQLAGANFTNMGYGKDQARSVNQFNYNQANKYLNKIQPQFSALQNQVGNNALSFSRGELPGDVQSQITRNAAQQGIQGGFGFGSQGAQGGALGNLNLRNLGLTSLDLSKYGTNLGMQVNQNAKALLPNMQGLQDYLLTPSQSLGIQQFNAGAQNQFDLANNQLLNGAIGSQNQQLANQAQSQYAQQLAQAQLIGQTGQQIGGAISGLGTGLGSSSAGQNLQPSQGLSYGQFSQRIGSPQQFQGALA
jgi:hypothetical protein